MNVTFCACAEGFVLNGTVSFCYEKAAAEIGTITIAARVVLASSLFRWPLVISLVLRPRNERAVCDLNMDVIPNVLEQPQIGIGAPGQHGTPVQFCAFEQCGAHLSYAAHNDCEWCGHESRRHSRGFAATAYWFWRFRAVRRSRQLRVIRHHRDRSRHEFQRNPVRAAKTTEQLRRCFPARSNTVIYCGPSVHVAPAPVVEYMTPAAAESFALPAPAEIAAPAPDVEYIFPAPAVVYGSLALTVYAAPAPVGKYISPTPTMIHAASAPIVEHIPPAPTDGYAAQCMPRQHMCWNTSLSPAISYVAPVHFVEYISPAPADYAASAPEVEYISSTPVVSYAAPAPVVEYTSPSPAVITRQLLW